MSRSTDRFITRMKLTELNRQRERLRSVYEEIRKAESAPQSEVARLRALFDGLADVTFANEPLHPGVSRLKLLPNALETGALGPQLHQLWLARTQEEVKRGELRSEIVYLFGALLEEWTRSDASDAAQAAKASVEADRLINYVTDDGGAAESEMDELLDEVFAGLEPKLAELGPRLSEKIGAADEISLPVMWGLLDGVRDNECQSAELREEAATFKADKNLAKDLQDALNLMLADVGNWRYAESGYPVEAVWTRNKWRLYPRFDLPTAALLEHLQSRWPRAFRECIGEDHERAVREARIAALKDLQAPDVILQNEYRMLKVAKDRISLGVGLVDPWADLDPEYDETAEPVSGCILNQRASYQEEVRESVGNRAYSMYGADNPLIALANAEIQTLSRAFPRVPLYVMKVDLQDYYPSIPHQLIVKILQRLGLEDQLVDFVRRYLSVPIGRDGRPAKVARRGVPMGYALSDVLANHVLMLLERFVQQKAAVRVIRQIDDVFVLTPDPDAVVSAWRRVNQFCDAAGLAVNYAKCGTVCIGEGSPPNEAPSGRPGWGLLVLDEQGEWSVSEEDFRRHLDQARNHVESTAGVLSKIQCYNENARFLLANLCCSNRLGDRHRASTLEAVRRFHLEFAGAGQSFADLVVAELRHRFRIPESLSIPESWMYWPVTAGGMGLFNPLIELSQYAGESPTVEFPSERKPDWDRADNEWSKAYETLVRSIPPAELEPTPDMQALIDDFIKRGKEISGGRQDGLSPYWRWILALFGPEILESFGTFRFLITELVPLRLINRRLLRAADEEMNDDD